MSVIFFDKISKIAISEGDPSFPREDELFEQNYPSEGYLSINEWQTYYVKFYNEDVFDTFTNIPFSIQKYPEGLYEINFKNYVGRTRICNIKLHVKNNKISDKLYDSMLDYISEKFAGLVFSFNKSVGLEYKKGEAGQDIPFIKYLFLKKYLLDKKPTIKEISGLILSETHRKLETEIQKCSIGELDHFDSSIVVSLCSDIEKMVKLTAGHKLLSTPLGNVLSERTGDNYYLSKAKRIRKYYTYDTNENRFIKHFANELLRELSFLKTILDLRSGTYLNPDIYDHIIELTQAIKYLLSDPIWNEVGRMNFIPVQSTFLQKREGYRHLFQLYSLLQLVTRYQFLIKDFNNLIETKDVPTLFEYWCFFLIKDILDSQFKTLDYTVIVPHADTEKTVEKKITITYEDNITLSYTPKFDRSIGVSPELSDIPNDYHPSDSYSHLFEPDIMIIKDGKQKLILDAKYKGKNGNNGFYGNEEDGSISSFKEEDLDKMHTYRDALRDVCGAFALYPGDKGVIYPSHQSKKLFEGVGALPLKPVRGGTPNPEHIRNIENVINAFLGL